MRNAPVDLREPINWRHPLNRGRTLLLLALRPGMGGTTWRDLCRQHDAALVSGPTWGATARPGGAGQVNFTGGDYAEASSSSAFDGPAGTWAGWFQFTGSTASFPLVMSRADASASHNGISVFLDAAAAGLRVQVAAAGSLVSDQTSAAVGLNGGVWHHWAFTWGQSNGASCTIYVDGKSQASGATTGAWTFNNQVVRLGKATDTFWQGFGGPMDAIAAWNRPLSASEVALAYALDRAGNPGVLNRLRPPLFGVTAAAPAVVFPWSTDTGTRLPRVTPTVMMPY